MKKLISIFCIMISLFSAAVFAAENNGLEETASYLLTAAENPTVSYVGGEWSVIGLARSGAEVPENYFEGYYQNVQNYVRSKNGVLHERKYTEYSRVILALTAIGKNPENIGGFDLIAPLLDYEKTVWQGINGPIWALIALDSGNYGSKEIRKQYLAHILECEKEGGGWSLSESDTETEADITAMALTALAPYRDNAAVNDTINRALSLLYSLQNENGGYGSGDSESSESAAQVLTALSSLGISDSDPRFVKNGKSLTDHILSFRQSDGSFAHTEQSSLMATEQCFYALTAAERLKNGQTSLFDMSDVKQNDTVAIGLSGKHPDVKALEQKFPKKTFDDIQGLESQVAIEVLAQSSVINGRSENSFFPKSTMTRAEFAAITVRALGLPKQIGSSFSDVKQNAWYAEAVGTACAYGIVNGVSESEFQPEATISVEQASVMVARAAKLCGINSDLNDTAVRNILAEFTDYQKVSDWAKSSLAFCFENNISDRSKIEIKPQEAVCREEIAQMLYHMLKGANLL